MEKIMNSTPIRIATRQSPLALWQAFDGCANTIDDALLALAVEHRRFAGRSHVAYVAKDLRRRFGRAANKHRLVAVVSAQVVIDRVAGDGCVPDDDGSVWIAAGRRHEAFAGTVCLEEDGLDEILGRAGVDDLAPDLTANPRREPRMKPDEGRLVPVNIALHQDPEPGVGLVVVLAAHGTHPAVVFTVTHL